MSIPLTIRLAWKNILANRLRSGLTILGLVIGIASVIILVGIGNGAASSVKSQVASLGTDIITVSITDSDNSLSYDQVQEMKNLSSVSEVSPYIMLSASVSKDGDVSSQSSIVGTSESYRSMMGYDLESGRDISRIDVDNSTKVAIIGSDVAEEFWGSGDPVGDTIKISGDNYTVIGVLDSAGSSMGNNIDEMILIPVSAARYLGEDTSITSLYVRASDEDKAESAAGALEQYLSVNCGIGEDAFTVSTQEMMLEAMEDINNTLSLLLGGIASISLLVGGIGVMNVMLVSVTERTREIGIRKSLGAKRKDILYQFLIEALVLSVTGGMIGIIAGFIGGQVAILAGASFAPGVGMIILSFAVSVAVGLIFGIFPANRAASLRPVEALRYE
ncbi:MAG: ABC transporter permease [Clostridia bacterium]|nr:ABC transporter permease [Clostridia bacterium]